MVNNTVFDILEPWMLIIGESSAVIVTQTRDDERGSRIAMDWKTVSISHMLEFSDIDAKRNGSKRKK
jgi:hypothetical protein